MSQSRSCLFFRARRDRARSRALLRERGARHRQCPARAALHAPPIPGRRRRSRGPPETLATGCPAVGGDGAADVPEVRPARRRTLRHAPGGRDLGGADVDGGVPVRGTADGPTPRSRTSGGSISIRCPTPPSRGCAAPRMYAATSSPSSVPSVSEDVGWARAAHLRAHRARARLPGCAPGSPRLRPGDRAASPGAAWPPPGGGATGTPRQCSSTTTRMRATTRSLRPIPCGATRAGPSVGTAGVGGDRRRRADDFTIATMPSPVCGLRRPSRGHRRRGIRHPAAAGVGGAGTSAPAPPSPPPNPRRRE